MSDTTSLRIRSKSSSAPHGSLVCNFVVVWVVWNTFCFLVKHFAITVMSSFLRHLFVGTALKIWPNTGLLILITVAYAIFSKAMSENMQLVSVAT